MLLLLALACPDPSADPDCACDSGAADPGDSGGADSGGADTGLPDCAVAELARDTAGLRPDCVEDLVTSRDCEVEPTAESQDGLLFAGTAYVDALGGASSATVTDAATWAALLASWGEGAPTDPVDFDTDLVVIVQDPIRSTCGATIEHHGVWDPEQSYYAPRVYARFRDSTGSCGWKCDMEQPLVVAYRVPRSDGFPIVCSEVENVCAP